MRKLPGYSFDRLEFAVALGDLRTLLPLSMGMILVNGLGITLATNLAAGFIVGISTAYALKSERLSV